MSGCVGCGADTPFLAGVVGDGFVMTVDGTMVEVVVPLITPTQTLTFKTVPRQTTGRAGELVFNVL